MKATSGELIRDLYRSILFISVFPDSSPQPHVLSSTKVSAMKNNGIVNITIDLGDEQETFYDGNNTRPQVSKK